MSAKRLINKIIMEELAKKNRLNEGLNFDPEEDPMGNICLPLNKIGNKFTNYLNARKIPYLIDRTEKVLVFNPTISFGDSQGDKILDDLEGTFGIFDMQVDCEKYQ